MVDSRDMRAAACLRLQKPKISSVVMWLLASVLTYGEEMISRIITRQQVGGKP